LTAQQWDIGSASWANIPLNRGFNSSLHYFEAAQDHFSQLGEFNMPKNMSKVSANCSKKYKDLWRDKGPAAELVGNYSGHLWTAEAERVLNQQSSNSAPFFMYLAYQNCHQPLQVQCFW
jgi:hypothetical protein